MTMTKSVLLSLLLLAILLPIDGVRVDLLRHNGVCPWLFFRNSTCLKTKFLCNNGKCIDRQEFCNGVYDCGDESDENGCNRRYFHQERNRISRMLCDDRYIPREWSCNGILDCENGEDEEICDHRKIDMAALTMERGLRWLYNQRKPESANEIWGSFVEKTAVALYLTDPTFSAFSNGTRKEIAHEVAIKFLSRLIRTKLEDIPATELASFLNAFLVSCIDPRKFHGINIVQELRNRVKQQNFTNPYVLLSLCNAGEKITASDKEKLTDTFWNKRRPFWTQMQAVSVMALACASNQQESEVDQETIRELTKELKLQHYKNGTLENLQTTALVMQALFAAESEGDPENFDEIKAMEQIISNQESEGSFGNFLNTYFALPVLSCKSLVNISTEHCKYVRRDEISALDSLAKQAGPKKHVHYSLWIGDDKDMEKNLILQVPLNMSLYGVMEIASEVDNRFSFEYVVKNNKPFINAILEFRDNPEKGKFWFLYEMKDGQPTPAQESPADVIPKDNDHFIMWYRSGSWTD